MADNEIPIRTLRNDVSPIIRRVEAGESFDVTRHGRPVARLVPIDADKRALTVAEFLEFRARVPADPDWYAEVRAMRDASPIRDPYER